MFYASKGRANYINFKILAKKYSFFGNKILKSVSNRSVRAENADEQFEILFWGVSKKAGDVLQQVHHNRR